MRVFSSVYRQLAVMAVLMLSLSAAQARMMLPDFTTIVERSAPAVVNISIIQNHAAGRVLGKNFKIPDLPEDSPLNELFKRFLDPHGGGKKPHGFKTRSMGSGFIISADGYILTNHHVVDGADEVLVKLSDRREFKARVIGSDEKTDVALVKIDADHLPVVKLGNSDDLKVGEWVLAIGSPFGLDHSASAGIISALGRSLPSENYVPFIQTDVAINPGNSGGPLFNLDGEVIGVNSQIYSRSGGYMGLSFSIPIDVAMNIVDQLRTTGHVSRGWLGVLIQDVSRDLAESFGLSRPRGALVAQVVADSPAAKAGLEPGDVILAYNHEDVEDSSSLPPLVGASPIDKPVEMTILRDGKKRSLRVVVGRLDEQGDALEPAHVEQSAKADVDRLGLIVGKLSEKARKALKLDGDNGVLVEEVAAGPAREAGIKAGDVILMFNKQRVRAPRDLKRLIEKASVGGTVPVLIQRRASGPMFLALHIPKS